MTTPSDNPAASVAGAMGRDLPEPIGGPFAEHLIVAFDIYDLGRRDSRKLLAKIFADGFWVTPDLAVSRKRPSR